MPRPNVTCPHCKKSLSGGDSPFWPFCSDRCKVSDLGDWAAEKFKLAVKQGESDPAEVTPDGVATDDESE